MDYIVHGVKSNQLENSIQVEVDEICMCTKFGEHNLTSFSDFCLLLFSFNNVV